jgi:hypothetical protein
MHNKNHVIITKLINLQFTNLQWRELGQGYCRMHFYGKKQSFVNKLEFCSFLGDNKICNTVSNVTLNFSLKIRNPQMLFWLWDYPRRITTISTISSRASQPAKYACFHQYRASSILLLALSKVSKFAYFHQYSYIELLM